MKAALFLVTLFFGLILNQSLYAATNKTWYFYVAGGGVFPTYFDEVQNAIDSIANNGGSRQKVLSGADFPAVYFPLGNSTAVGFDLNFFIDSATGVAGSPYNQKITLIHTHFSPSLLQFFGSEIGTGFFMRFDLGGSMLRRIVTDQTTSTTNTTDFAGLSTLGGIGYGFHFTNDFDVLLSTSYFYSVYNDKPVHGYFVSAGALF